MRFWFFTKTWQIDIGLMANQIWYHIFAFSDHCGVLVRTIFDCILFCEIFGFFIKTGHFSIFGQNRVWFSLFWSLCRDFLPPQGTLIMWMSCKPITEFFVMSFLLLISAPLLFIVANHKNGFKKMVKKKLLTLKFHSCVEIVFMVYCITCFYPLFHRRKWTQNSSKK